MTDARKISPWKVNPSGHVNENAGTLTPARAFPLVIAERKTHRS